MPTLIRGWELSCSQEKRLRGRMAEKISNVSCEHRKQEGGDELWALLSLYLEELRFPLALFPLRVWKETVQQHSWTPTTAIILDSPIFSIPRLVLRMASTNDGNININFARNSKKQISTQILVCTRHHAKYFLCNISFNSHDSSEG